MCNAPLYNGPKVTENKMTAINFSIQKNKAVQENLRSMCSYGYQI